MVRSHTPNAPSPAISAKSRSGAPIAKSMPQVMAASMNALPKSPSRSTSTIMRPATGSRGMRRCFQLLSRWLLRDNRSAPHTISANLANSLGCRRNGPKRSIQLRCPATSTPINNTRISNSNVMMSRSHEIFRQSTTAVRAARIMTITPITANIACRCAKVYADPNTR